jgi:hypothetical protein
MTGNKKRREFGKTGSCTFVLEAVVGEEGGDTSVVLRIEP